MMLRVVLGVILGDVIFAGGSALLFYLARVDPHAPSERNFMLLASVAGIVFALAGGFTAGWIGRRDDLICGMLLAVIIAIGAIISMVSRPGLGAIWSQLAALVTMAPAALVGDGFRLKRMKAR